MKRILLFASLVFALGACPVLAAEAPAVDATMANVVPAGNVVPPTEPLEPGGDGLATGGGAGGGAAAAAAPTVSQPDTTAPAADATPTPAPERTPMARAPHEEATSAPAPGAFVREDQPFKLRDYEDPKPAPQAPWWQQVLGFGFKLALVIGLIFVSLGTLKKISGGRVALPSSKGHNMVVLETTHLGPQQAVHLISVGGDRLLVVGATPQGLTKLAELTDLAQVRRFLDAGRGSASPFNQLYDLESVGADHQQDLFAETMREVGDRFGARRPEWPKS